MATSLGLSSVIAELRDALTRLPNELHTEGASIVRDRTHEAEEAIRTGYPDRTGNLRKGLKATVETPQFAAVGIVRNTAPHAYMFENGTQARHTSLGSNRGSMPPGKVFIPTMIRVRRAMFQNDLRGLLERAGLVVSGDHDGG
jgi:hypothetical protein